MLTWAPIEGAMGYYMEIYDGKKWNRYDIGDTTIWDSGVAKIYPTEAFLKNYTDNTYTEEMFLHDKLGLELRDNPINVYLKTIGQAYDNRTTYLIRVRPYITTVTTVEDGEKVEEQIEGPVGSESIAEIQMPNRTDMTSLTVTTLVEYIEQYKAAYITVTMKDTESGPKDIIPYNTNGLTPISSIADGVYMTNIYKVSANGTYTFTVKDNVNWYTVVDVNVTDINPNKPILIFNREGKIVSDVHLAKDTENINYTSYRVATETITLSEGELANGVINIDLIINPEHTNYTVPYYVTLRSANGTELMKHYEVTINGDKTEVVEKY
ncbi:MAG: hypothetical protein A2Y24_07395 [Clostridiales bacterium GWE2_32_10]|nr:MAG: hypothetical protein A2Y24_07395 [Clostridiales bacterium GWE2_32_10]HBY21006.1 hypothetical protein [Clostridiales bacterium]